MTRYTQHLSCTVEWLPTSRLYFFYSSVDYCHCGISHNILYIHRWLDKNQTLFIWFSGITKQHLWKRIFLSLSFFTVLNDSIHFLFHLPKWDIFSRISIVHKNSIFLYTFCKACVEYLVVPFCEKRYINELINTLYLPLYWWVQFF